MGRRMKRSSREGLPRIISWAESRTLSALPQRRGRRRSSEGQASAEGDGGLRSVIRGAEGHVRDLSGGYHRVEMSDLNEGGAHKQAAGGIGKIVNGQGEHIRVEAEGLTAPELKPAA